MSIKKDERDRTIVGKNVIRIISQREQLPIQEVQNVFNCFYELLEMAMSDGYIVYMPCGLGKFKFSKTRCMKVGSILKIHPKMVEFALKKAKDDEYSEIFSDEDGNYYKRYIKEKEPSFTPKFIMSKALRNRVKERSKQWQE